jgi:hypothetical protein
MLLEQPGGPLIVDQPEGDLDNKIIAEGHGHVDGQNACCSRRHSTRSAYMP